MSNRYSIVPHSLCPGCGTSITAAGTLSGEHSMPMPGDTTVCIHCARILVFDATLKVVEPEPAKLALWFAEDPEWGEEITRIQAVVRGRPKPTPEKRGAVH